MGRYGTFANDIECFANYGNFNSRIVNNKAFRRTHAHTQKLLVAHIVYASLICSVPVTFVLTIFNPTFSVKSPLYVWGIQYLYVLVVSLVVGSILYPLLHMMGAIGAKSVNEGLDNGPSTFLKRLPLKYHEADLYAVSSEDHYLRVYTNIGEELILMRLADALKELSETKGLQVHRSWWVHEASVLGYRTEGGRRFLTLKQDLKVPVSRSYIKQVQQTLKLG